MVAAGRDPPNRLVAGFVKIVDYFLKYPAITRNWQRPPLEEVKGEGTVFRLPRNRKVGPPESASQARTWEQMKPLFRCAQMRTGVSRAGAAKDDAADHRIALVWVVRLAAVLRV